MNNKFPKRFNFLKRFKNFDLGEFDPSCIGFAYAYLSVFDHWLDENEADECLVLNYMSAKENNALYEYLLGEKMFINFYSELAEQGVVFNKPKKTFSIDGKEDYFTEIIKESLREKRFMDVYFVKHKFRVKGRFDRSDVLFFDSDAEKIVVEKIARRNGLFFLN